MMKRQTTRPSNRIRSHRNSSAAAGTARPPLCPVTKCKERGKR
jgi:hypothetical protein